jgi:hypothetical protein
MSPPADDPFLPLDQVSTGGLVRVAKSRNADAPDPQGERVRVGEGRNAGRFKRVLKAILAPGFLLIGIVTIAMAIYGFISVLSDDDGLSARDILRLGLVALVSLLVLAQVVNTLSSSAWFRRAFSRGQELYESGPTRALLLGKLTDEEMISAAPADLGRSSLLHSAAASGRRGTSSGLWKLLILGLLAFCAFSLFGLLAALVYTLAGGDLLGLGFALQLVLTLVSAGVLALLARAAVRALSQHRMRSRLLQRALRYLSRAPGQVASSVDRLVPTSLPLRFGEAIAAMLAVIMLGLAPAILADDEDDGVSSVAAATATQGEVATESETSTPTPTPTPECVPTVTVTPTPSPAATPTPTPTAVENEDTCVPGPTAEDVPASTPGPDPGPTRRDQPGQPAPTQPPPMPQTTPEPTPTSESNPFLPRLDEDDDDSGSDAPPPTPPPRPTPTCPRQGCR